MSAIMTPVSRRLVVFRLHAGEHQIDAAQALYRLAERRGHHVVVARVDLGVVHVNAPVRAHREGLADFLGDPVGPRGDDNHLAAEFLLELQGRFHRVLVEIVHLERNLGFINLGITDDFELGFHVWNLFH